MVQNPTMVICNVHNDVKQVKFIESNLPILAEKGYNLFLSELNVPFTDYLSIFSSMFNIFFSKCYYWDFLMMQSEAESGMVNLNPLLEKRAKNEGFSIDSISFLPELFQDIKNLCYLSDKNMTSHARYWDNAVHVTRGDLMYNKIKELHVSNDGNTVVLVGALHCPYFVDKLAQDPSVNQADFRFVFPHDESAFEAYVDVLHKAGLHSRGMTRYEYAYNAELYNNDNGNFPVSYYFASSESKEKYLGDLRSKGQLVKISDVHNKTSTSVIVESSIDSPEENIEMIDYMLSPVLGVVTEVEID